MVKKKKKKLRKWSSGLSQEERQSAKMPRFKFIADFRDCCCFKNGWIRLGVLKRLQGQRSDSSSSKLHGSRALFNLVSPLHKLIILVELAFQRSKLPEPQLNQAE